ncbi:MAG: radical SAM protein [Monoglobales bacterium]
MYEQINLLVMPTDQCNMRCKYCFHGNSGYSKEIMDLEIFKKVILSIVDKWSRVQIVWHGGEPLCVPLEFYKEAYAFCESTHAEFIYSLQTNATLLSQEKIDFFKDKHTKIGISYDGLTNDYVRGNTSKIVENIRKLKANGIEPGAIIVYVKIKMQKKGSKSA